ncbi:MAG: squalene synthase HpnC [Thermotogota bacterium]
MATFEEARDLCLALTRAEGENFTVVSWLAPKAMREHLTVVYAYCRTVDNLGDEGWALDGRRASDGTVPDRIALLDEFEAELDFTYAGAPRHPIFVALRPTIERFDLPREPFARLIEANRMDQRDKRHATFADLLHYCEHSATPVGRLVLGLYERGGEEENALSDATCIGLQLANFWQDVKRDYEMGRVYLPQDEMAEYGVRDEDLATATASESVRRLLRFQVERARGYFARGLPLLDRVSGHLRVDLALFSRGGLAILDKIERQNYDTLSQRPTVSKMEKVGILLSTLAGRRWKRWI